LKRIIIIGTTGSGKSTLAKALASKLSYPYIQLDSLFWKADWQGEDDPEFFKKIESAISADHWIIDGNYGRSHHLSWPKADTVIWIDLPFALTFYQNFTRSLKRAIVRKELWPGTGNRESFLRMLSKDSILLWLIKTYKTNKQRYEERMVDPDFSHLTFYRLRSRKEINDFLHSY
tara:strand:+ start:2588 stop:3112 length:525 start_codon:yes stop_codon:yes gene_type:complete